MKVSITKAAELAGVSRTTLYNDMNSGKVTFVSSGKNKKVIDVSELERVYGSIKINSGQESSTNVKTEQNFTQKKEEGASALIELAVLRDKVDTLETERKREREQFEDRIEQLQETLNKTQDNQSKTTLLLEHYTKEGKGNEWEQAMKTLEERISNNEETVKLEKEKAQKAEEEKKKLEEALEFEKSKSFIHRLFGK